MNINARQVSEFRRRRKENLVHVCGDKCCLCGYNRVIAGLEFHHINPEQKSYGISAGGICHNLEDDLTEVRKCVLVCSNCHREIHDGYYTEQELWQHQIFLEDVANHLREIKGRRLDWEEPEHCAVCGKPLSRDAKRTICQDCYIKQKHSVRPNREQLKELIRTTPFTKIGEIYGVSDNAIRKWCKAVNLPTKSREIKSYTDDQWSKI